MSNPTDSKARTRTQAPGRIDADACTAFLNFLGDALGVFAFQTYDDDKARNDTDRGKTYIGTFDERRRELVTANRDRCAVHVTINDTAGKRRNAENVVRVRKHFVEIDGTHTLEEIRSIAAGRGLDIAWINESSPGKFHVYFNVADDVGADLQGFRYRQKQLVAVFDGGRESVDLPRVLRLPGFYHRKGEPFMVRTVYKDETAHAHTLDDFDIVLGGVAVDITTDDASGTVAHEEDQAAIDRAIEHFQMFPEAVSDTPNGKMGKKGNSQTFDAIAAAKDFGLDEQTNLELALKHYNPRCKPEWPYEQLETIVRNVYAYTKSAQGSKHPLVEMQKEFGDEEDLKDAVAGATKAAADLREKKHATWTTLKTDYAYVTQQEVFVSRTQISPSNSSPAQYSVRGFDRKFGYVKRELELGRTKLTDYIFERMPGTGFDFFESFSYMPGKPENFDGNLNLWRQSGVEPKQGDVQWFYDHLNYLFDVDSKHVLNWMSWVYRYQDLHPKHALLTHGEHQGTGKSVIANAMRRLLGASNCTLLDQSALELDHDGWKVRTKLLMIEEVRPGFGSSNAVMKKLHPLISEDTVHVDMKNRQDFDMSNVMAVLEGSNKPDALTMDDSDRRQLIVSTDRDGVALKPKNLAYYRTIYGKDGVGGYLNDDAAMAAIAYDLLNRPLGDYSAQSPAPYTAAKGRMIAATGSALQKWMLENPLDVRLVNINQTVKRIDADAPDIVRKHRGDIRADIEDIYRRKFKGLPVKMQIRPHGRTGGKMRVWAIGPDAATTATLKEGKLNAIYRADYPAQFKGRAVDDFDDDDYGEDA
jgi:hypothetical protein